MLTQDAAYLYGNAQTVYKDFGGVALTEEEGNKIGLALVSEACLMTLMERACQCQLLAEAAEANGLQKLYILDKSARYTFENLSDPETLYWEGQPYLQFEEHMSNGEHRN